jgi:hypothetical protein
MKSGEINFGDLPILGYLDAHHHAKDEKKPYGCNCSDRFFFHDSYSQVDLM